MTADKKHLLQKTRRHFFQQCGVGVGQMALASLLNRGSLLAAGEPSLANPLAPRPPHFPAKAKSVIYLFMAGGPSQLELYDYKPKLTEYDGKNTPPSVLEGQRFAFMDSFTKETPKLLGPRRKFQQHGQTGRWISEELPQIGSIIDELTFTHTVKTENFNHGPAKIFTNTGSTVFGRPSMGAWVTYGIGSESQDLPGFVVLQSGPRGPRGGALNWGAGFIPTAYQGVPFRSGGDPILNLSSPPGFDTERQGETLSAIRELNQHRLDVTGDPEITTRIAQYEMAFRMQTSGPELIDFSTESKETLELYGAEPGARSFANNCLLARRLVERGVRFVQLYHADWDHHGGPNENLGTALSARCQEIDRPCAALVQDLKRRGLLKDTLVVWGGEFGRTPMGEVRETVGRNHHIAAYTMWFAGGGMKPGVTLGQTDELGFFAAEHPVHVHDIQATVLHLLGLDHTKLTYRYLGRDFRLTDVSGEVLHEMLA
jgi:hypothetical protein